MFTEKSKKVHQEKQSDNLASCSYTEIFNLLFFILFDAQQYVESALQLSIVQF